MLGPFWFLFVRCAPLGSPLFGECFFGTISLLTTRWLQRKDRRARGLGIRFARPFASVFVQISIYFFFVLLSSGSGGVYHTSCAEGTRIEDTACNRASANDDDVLARRPCFHALASCSERKHLNISSLRAGYCVCGGGIIGCSITFVLLIRTFLAIFTSPGVVANLPRGRSSLRPAVDAAGTMRAPAKKGTGARGNSTCPQPRHCA